MMKTSLLLNTTRRQSPGSLVCIGLWILALHFSDPVLGQSVYSTPYTFTTLAGLAGSRGSTDGTGSAARFFGPNSLALDSAGNVYVADSVNNTIRKVTPAGDVTTLAGLAGNHGSTDGTGSNARFGDGNTGPSGVAVDNSGNVYVADSGNNTIRRVTPTGMVTTLAGLALVNAGTNDGTGSAARFDQPTGVAVDSATNIYVADYANYTIRKVTPVGTNWVVTTLAGLAGSYGTTDGTGSAARFQYPNGVAVDSLGNVYVADQGNEAIRKVTPAGAVTTLAGLGGYYNAGSSDGLGSNARFYLPSGVAVDSAANVYVADAYNHTIRKITPAGLVTTLAGLAGTYGSADGTGSVSRFHYPFGAAVDNAGNIYVADANSATIRKGFLASSVPAPILRPLSPGADPFGFGITGVPNLAVDILSSSNLSQWQVVTNCVLVGGTNYCVPPAPSQDVQFYRAHVR